MSLAIETEHLGRRYADVRAVEDLSLRVEEGGIYSFLGLNGAGKTTTIRMLLGMIHPGAGQARVLRDSVCAWEPGNPGARWATWWRSRMPIPN